MLGVQHQNLVMSSFVLYLQNLLLQNGGYINVGTKFYPTTTIFNGYTSFSAPYKPIIFDKSYSGPTIMTGISCNGSNLILNQSGFAGVDYLRGSVYFTGSNTPNLATATISGNYSIPEYNVLFPAPDVSLIFEGKMSLNNRNKSPLNLPNTGLVNSEITYPCIMVRSEGMSNEPYEFGGTDTTTTKIGCYIFSDNLFSFDSLRSILNDQKTEYFALLNTGEMPTNNINSLKNGMLFNYTGIASLPGRIGSGNALWIKDIITTDFSRRGLFSEISSLPPDIHFGVIDFEINIPRLT